LFISTPPEPSPLETIPPDLRIPWTWGDVGIFFLFYFISTVAISVAILAGASVVMHIAVPDLVKKTSVFVSLSIVGQAIASIVTMIYFWMITRARRAGNFWQAMGWRPLGGSKTSAARATRYLLGGVGLALASSLLSQFFGEPQNVPFNEFFQTRQNILLMMGLGILIAPLVEETMFRGFLYPVAARSFGVMWGIIGTGLLFGSFHAMQLWGAWGQVAVLMGVGIVLTWVRARSQSVLASFLIHIAYNSSLFLGLFISTHGLKSLPPGN
jgi:membrane protease YdiL (CAAX protease family)